MRLVVLSLIAACGIVPAFAQNNATRRATLTGNGGSDGKCTIEIEVDQSVDVEVSGDTGRLVTRSGQPASWRRFECSGPLPSRSNNFRFKGIDGRGRVNLVQDPNNNRGVAVVRIDDTGNGREGYTFDLIWQGGSGTDGGFGSDRNDRFGRDPNSRYDQNNRNDRRYDRQNNRGDNNRDTNISRLTCSSDDTRRKYCNADTRRGVLLSRQLSDAECRYGSTWGFDGRGVWVDRGCRAEFEVGQ